MHYIIGTTILINEFTQHEDQAGYGVNLSNRARQRPKKNVNTTPFQTGVQYTLYNIAKVGHMFEYTFMSGNDQQPLVLQFNNPTHADNYIAFVKGEPLPDYEHINRLQN